MCLLPLEMLSQKQLSTNQNLFNARPNSRKDIPLDMYRLA